MADCFWTDLINCHEDCGESQATTFNLFLSDDDYYFDPHTGEGDNRVGEIYGDTTWGEITPNELFVGPTARALSIAIPCRFLERPNRAKGACYGEPDTGYYVLNPYFWIVPPDGGAAELGWEFDGYGNLTCVSQSLTNLDTSDFLDLSGVRDDGGFFGNEFYRTPADRVMDQYMGYDPEHPDDWLYIATPVLLNWLYADPPNIANGVLSVVCDVGDSVVSGQNLQIRKALAFASIICPG